MEHMNKHQQWRQGSYIKPIRSRVSVADIIHYDRHEKRLVRPYPKENAICQTERPEQAAWIAKRLNRAAELEEVIEKVRKLINQPPHNYELAIQEAVDILKEVE